MTVMPRHTRSYLVCSIFICLCLFLEPSSAEKGSPNYLTNIEDFRQNFIHHDYQSEPSLIQPQLSGNEIFFPIDSYNQVGDLPPAYMPHSQPSKETVIMNGSNSKHQMQDMYALNAKMQRDIVFDDAQSVDSMKKGLKNSEDISIDRNRPKPSIGNNWMDSRIDDGVIENIVDNATVFKQHDDPVYYQSSTGSPEQRLGNYMNIVVSGVDVRATNTVRGGSAVATSNIIIKPVQIINCPPEVEEKLK